MGGESYSRRLSILEGPLPYSDHGVGITVAILNGLGNFNSLGYRGRNGANLGSGCRHYLIGDVAELESIAHSGRSRKRTTHASEKRK